MEYAIEQLIDGQWREISRDVMRVKVYPTGESFRESKFSPERRQRVEIRKLRADNVLEVYRLVQVSGAARKTIY